MTLFEALILGIVQGATEFLPISSSGHLVLLPAIFGLSQPTLGVIAVAHLGNLVDPVANIPGVGGLQPGASADPAPHEPGKAGPLQRVHHDADPSV